jgi:hypothetical protein
MTTTTTMMMTIDLNQLLPPPNRERVQELLDQFFSIPPPIGNDDEEEEGNEKKNEEPILQSKTNEKEAKDKHFESKKSNSRNRKFTRGNRIGKYSKKAKKTNFIVEQKPICKFYLENRCSKGNDCSFRHEGTPKPKSDFCKFFIIGACTKGDECPYSHNLSEFPCKHYFIRGFCQRNPCQYSHDKNSILPERFERMMQLEKERQEKLNPPTNVQEQVDPMKDIDVLKETILNTNAEISFGNIFES